MKKPYGVAALTAALIATTLLLRSHNVVAATSPPLTGI